MRDSTCSTVGKKMPPFNEVSGVGGTIRVLEVKVAAKTPDIQPCRTYLTVPRADSAFARVPKVDIMYSAVIAERAM